MNTEDDKHKGKTLAEISMTEAFDKTDEVSAEIEPLFEQIHAICKKHGLPFYAAIVTKNDPANSVFHTTTSVHFNGPERTPPTLVAAQTIISRLDSGAAARLMTTINILAQISDRAEQRMAGTAH